MNADISFKSVKTVSEQIDAKISNISMLVDKLEEGARVDMAPKLSRLQTMNEALIRDISEAETPGGADRETVFELAETLERKTDDLLREVQALSSGNPTTVSAAVDAVDRILS